MSTPDFRKVRDSENPAGGVLALGPVAWDGLRIAVKSGDLARRRPLWTWPS